MLTSDYHILAAIWLDRQLVPTHLQNKFDTVDEQWVFGDQEMRVSHVPFELLSRGGFPFFLQPPAVFSEF